MLQSATPTEHNQQPTPANIADFRHDLVAIAEYTIKEFDVADNRDDDTAIFGTTASSIAASDESKEFLHYLSYIPEQLSGKMACNVDINQSIDSPAIQTKFSLTDIAIDHQPMPTVNADLSFDTASRTLSIQQLTARGGPDPNAELRVDPGGRVKFPLRDAQGNELQPGQLSDIVVETQNLNPSYFSHWNSKLGKLGGEMNLTIFTLDNSTTSRPQLKASIDWKKPEINGIDLDVINATMTLDNDPTDPSVQRLWIGQHGFSTIQLKNSDITDAKPLEISGYLPVRWLGLTASPIPDDKPFSLKVHIPDQPLQQLALDYLPKLSNGKRIFSSDGTISGTVQVGGTLREPEFEDSSALYVKSSEVTLPIANSDIPNRLSNLNVDLSLIAEHENNKVKNAIILNDVSSFYDRADKKVKKPSLWDKVKVAIGIDKPKQTPLPCIVMRGSIEIPTPTGGVASFADFSAQARAAMKQIHYDIYAKTLRTPISWGELFKGTMTSYLHLGNSPSNPARPRITGLIYSEDSKVTYTGSAGAQVNSLQLPFDPELSLLIQVGQKNALVLEPKNAVLPQGSVWAQLPLIPTGPKLFSPDAVTDPVINSSRLGVKPFLSNHPLHLCNAETLDDGSDEFSKGSYGKVTGSLSKPVIDLIYQLEPEKSQVQLPGGLLVVDSMQGTFHCDLGASEPAKLIARGSATGTLDRYGISANVDGDLLTADHLPVIALATTSTPPGSAPLTPDEIWNRLIGVDDIVALVRGEQSILSPVMISKLGPNMLLGPWMRGLASAMRLNTLSLSFDQSWNPETTLTTPEFGKSRWSSFRLGASGTITDIPTWRVWLDYTIPTKLWWLQNLAVTAEVSNQSDSINSTTPITATTGQKYFNWQLQYTIPFKTTLKNK
ncbi:MAG TPA: hypothetical protein VHV83_12220 [Armatimonadota bacterium]|nr:hypothetical protein [Armatimonadota bacterium]